MRVLRPLLSLLLLLALPISRAEVPHSTAAELLAPQRSDLLAHLAAAEGHLRDAAALGAALGRIHNHLAVEGRLRCDAPDAPSLAWRAAVLGQAWRDALQSARAEAVRTTRMRAAPTVAPLLSPAEGDRLDRLDVAVVDAVHAWQAAAGWQQAYITPWARRCPWTAPAARPGLPSAVSATATEQLDPIAVLAVGADGMLCPAGIPTTAAGVAVVLATPQACVQDTGAMCGCVPQGVLPGAVLVRAGDGDRGMTP